MKVIFLKHVQQVAKKFDVKDVADGYALNFLFPNGLAEMASEKSLTRLEKLIQQSAAEGQIQADLLAKNLKSLESVTIELEKKANEKGHLFDSVHKELLSEELLKQANLTVPTDFIDLEKPIKETGEHEVAVKVGDASATFKVVINAL